MVESVPALKPFTTVNYTTKDGEHISATKNNGIVTLVGDKNGTRQMPLEDFMKEFAENIPTLERTPEKDTVELSNTAVETVAQAPVATAETKVPTAQEVGKKLDISA